MAMAMYYCRFESFIKPAEWGNGVRGFLWVRQHIIIIINISRACELFIMQSPQDVRNQQFQKSHPVSRRHHNNNII